MHYMAIHLGKTTVWGSEIEPFYLYKRDRSISLPHTVHILLHKQFGLCSKFIFTVIRIGTFIRKLKVRKTQRLNVIELTQNR